VCDISASANGNCDQTADWRTVAVDSGCAVYYTSIAADASGDPVISYRDGTNLDLKFAICDRSASANGNCDQTGDWSMVIVDAVGDVGTYTSIAVDGNGDPMISYRNGTNSALKFAICDRSASANGNCNQTGDWRTVAADSGCAAYYTSIAVDANGEPMISYYDGTNSALKFAVCDTSASANGNCDQTGDWSTQTVDSAGVVGTNTSIAVDANGEPMISYSDDTNLDLKFATASPPAPVGGLAELPDASVSSAPDYIALAALAAALVALSAGAWYARRRWLG
jgi:hypothetical protein